MLASRYHLKPCLTFRKKLRLCQHSLQIKGVSSQKLYLGVKSSKVHLRVNAASYVAIALVANRMLIAIFCSNLREVLKAFWLVAYYYRSPTYPRPMLQAGIPDGRKED